MMHLGLDFERALVYALHVHGGHTRKGTDIPYFSHLMAVSATVIENGGTKTRRSLPCFMMPWRIKGANRGYRTFVIVSGPKWQI